MKVLFLGTGDAFSARANTSILIDGRILLDCGLTTVQQLMKADCDLKKISVVSISHFHMDHVFGVPAFLCACRKQGRKKPLSIIGPADSEKYINELLAVAHKTLEDFEYETRIADAAKCSIDGYDLSYADMLHSLPCKAVSLGICGKKLSFTGDGRPTPEALELMEGSDLVIAEAYMDGHTSHSSIPEVIEYAKIAKANNIALVHISPKEDLERKIGQARKTYPNLLVPQDLFCVEL
jgi:ribonuclease Z